MKAKELKIGDIVSFLGNPTKVQSIDPPAIYVVDKDDTIWGTNEINNDVTPIPLTSEILEKNGWEKGDWCFIKDFLTLVRLENKTKGFSFSIYGGKSRYNINYVHELQHLLWALGMDDDLKI